MVKEEMKAYFKPCEEADLKISENKTVIEQLKIEIAEVDNKIAGLENRVKLKELEKEKNQHVQMVANFDEAIKEAGFFAGKQKKELKSKKETHVQAINDLEKEINEIRNAHADELEPIENKLIELQDKKDALVKENESIKESNSKMLSLKESAYMQYEKEKEKFDFKAFLKDYDELSSLQVRETKKGSFITFGNYYQKNEKEKEPIEWKLVYREGRYGLFISKFILNAKQFNDRPANNFDHSTLKEWLNTEFKEEAFSYLERSIIKDDEVTLLTTKDIEKHFKKDKDLKAIGTPYAQISGLYVASDQYSHYWLNSKGESDNFEAITRSVGIVNAYGTDVMDKSIGVRPAIWVNVK